MKKYQIGLILLMLSACSPHPTPPVSVPAPTVVSSPTEPVMTSTAAPTATQGTPAAQGTSVTGTPTTCVDAAESVEWLRDDMPYDFVNLKSNKPVPPNGRFTMSLTLKNTGTCAWDESYAIVFDSGYQMTQSARYPVVAEGKTLAPGQTTTVHMSMAAPPKTGGHQGLWRLQSLNGILLKINIYVKVDKGTYSPPASPLQLTYKATCADGFAKIRLAWVDAADNEDGYRIYRNSKMLVQLPANTDSVLDAILKGGGKYTYNVVAYNVAGEGSTEMSVEIEDCK
jgi:hypothetical protein